MKQAFMHWAVNTNLTKPVEILEVCLVQSIPHYFNVHVIQILPVIGLLNVRKKHDVPYLTLKLFYDKVAKYNSILLDS